MSLLWETMKKAFTILFAGEFGLASMSNNLLLAFVLSHTITGLYAAVQNWGLKELKARQNYFSLQICWCFSISSFATE